MGFDKCQLRVEEDVAQPNQPHFTKAATAVCTPRRAAAATVAMDGGNEACASTHYSTTTAANSRKPKNPLTEFKGSLQKFPAKSFVCNN